MLVAKDVYMHTVSFAEMKDLIAQGQILAYKPEFVKDFLKRKHDSPTEMFYVSEFITYAMYHGQFSFTALKANCFPLNSDSFCIPLLEKNRFEVIEIEGGKVKVSWEKGLPAEAG